MASHIRKATYIAPSPLTELAAADVTAVLQCIHDLHAAEGDFAALPGAVLRLLSGLVRSKVAAFTQVDPVLGESTGCMLPPAPWTVEWVAPRFQAHIADHPVVAHSQRTRDGQARAISDFLTPRQFHATGLYREVFRPMGIEDQLSIGMVGSAGLMIGVSFNRARRGFSERDRLVLNVLRPHLLQAYLNGRETARLRDATARQQRGTIVDQLPVGLVCVDRAGRIAWSTDPARQLFAAHYADAADSIHGLPDAVRRWLRAASSPGRSAGAAQTLVARRPGAELRVRYCPLKDRTAILLLQETAVDPGPPKLTQYGLTDREEQVMRRFAAGDNVPGVAAHLSISPRTVQKHLERIFQKLGVGTLAAACVKVLG